MQCDCIRDNNRDGTKDYVARRKTTLGSVVTNSGWLFWADGCDGEEAQAPGPVETPAESTRVPAREPIKQRCRRLFVPEAASISSSTRGDPFAARIARHFRPKKDGEIGVMRWLLDFSRAVMSSHWFIIGTTHRAIAPVECLPQATTLMIPLTATRVQNRVVCASESCPNSGLPSDRR